MLRVFLVFLSLRLSFALPAALACPSLCSLIAWCAPWSTRGNSALRFGCRQVPSPQSVWTARRVHLQLIDADLYDGTASWGGEVLFHLAPIVFFSPYSILLGVVRSHCVQLHKRGVGVVLTPFGQCHCTTEMRGVIPLENPVFTPPSAASLRRNGGLGRGGSFSFSLLVFFSPYSILLGVVHSHCVQLHKRGVGTFVCRISWAHRPYGEASNDAGARNERDVGATAENTGATARKREAFRTALRVRLREASTPRVVAPCRRRAREEAERHGRERDKCRAKT